MTTDADAIRDREGLATFLESRSEDEITVGVLDMGIDSALSRIFEVMQADYLTAEGPRERAVVQWEVEPLDGQIQVWQNVADRLGFSAARGVAEEPDVVLRIDLVAFLELMARRVRGIQLLSAGTLRLKGDVQLAMEMEAWFAP